MNVLITTSTFGEFDASVLERLRAAGMHVTMNPHGRTLTEGEVKDLLSGMEGLIAGTEPLTRAVMESASSLRAIVRCGAGTSNVDMVAARERGVVVDSTPDAPTQSVAELTVALLLDVLRRVSATDRRVRRGEWKKTMGGLLCGKTVGIIGMGRIGRRVAGLVTAFGARVVWHDVAPHTVPTELYGSGQSLNDLLSQSQIVLVHASTDACLLDAEALARLPAGAVVINMGRGGAVDEGALVAALTSGQLSGAGLDVFAREPYTGPLTSLDQVVMTAHMGSYAVEGRVAMEAEAVDRLLRALVQTVPV